MSASNCGLVVNDDGEGERVRVEVGSDESARRIEAVLGSLGFDVVRDLSRHGGDLFEDVATVAAKRYRLTAREQEMLLAALRGGSQQEIGEQLGVRVKTVKWHLHNIYCKLGVESRELLLRRVLRLDDLTWLREPRRQRDALELLDQAAQQALDAIRAQQSDEAIRLLDQALIEARHLAAGET